uniref:Uncharacterized protein n=1 Tax=Physcomitrium patens TaxID=3218 RepID=A0A7I4B2B5_PHYPA
MGDVRLAGHPSVRGGPGTPVFRRISNKTSVLSTLRRSSKARRICPIAKTRCYLLCYASTVAGPMAL